MNSEEGIIEVGAHRFERLGLLRKRGSCRRCYLPSTRHPTRGYTPARPMSFQRDGLRLALVLIGIALLALVFALRADAYLVAHPKNDTLAAVYQSQKANLAHASYVCRRGHHAHKRWACWAASSVMRPNGQGWLRANMLQTAHALLAARLRAVNDYMTAVRYVERFFGPQPFLRSCPDSEGGYGHFVYNREGSRAGGWLQFMEGTFYSVIDDAIRHAREKGMPVPSSARSWFSPLGQALAGVEMLRDGRRGEFEGVTC